MNTIKLTVIFVAVASVFPPEKKKKGAERREDMLNAKSFLAIVWTNKLKLHSKKPQQ